MYNLYKKSNLKCVKIGSFGSKLDHGGIL